MTWIESFTFPKLWKPLPVLDCKLDQSKDIVSFGILSLSQLDVDAKSQFFWVFCNGGSVTTGLSKEKGILVLKSMMVIVIIFRQPLVQEHDGDGDDGDGDHLLQTIVPKHDGDGDGDHL